MPDPGTPNPPPASAWNTDTRFHQVSQPASRRGPGLGGGVSQQLRGSGKIWL